MYKFIVTIAWSQNSTRYAKDDKAMAMVPSVGLLRGAKVNSAFPPSLKNASIQK